MSQQTLSPLKRSIVGVQFMFVAFGSTVLVPLLVGFDPAIALLAAGLGTLLFHAVTGGKVPIYLGSSFAFNQTVRMASRCVSPCPSSMAACS